MFSRRSHLPNLLKLLPGVLPFLALIPGATRAAPTDLAATIPITAPDFPPAVFGADAPPPVQAQPNLLYVNFDGATMNWCGGSNDPKNNCSTIFQGDVLPFEGDAVRRAAVVQVIRQDFRDFAIAVTDVRPGDGVDYDMEMVGNWDPPPQGGFAGVAPSIDCFNGEGGEVSFTLDYTQSPGGIARAILQEVAHTWGLEHVESEGDLLYPTTAGVPDPKYLDECFQIVELNQANNPVPTSGICDNQHEQFCGSNQQNSYRELLQLFGPHAPDLVAPTVEIAQPAAGAQIEGAFDIEIKAADEQSPQILIVQVFGVGPSNFETDKTAYASPADLKFPVKGLPAGDYTVSVSVEDEEGNKSEDAVDFTVLGAQGPDTTGTDTGTGDESSDDTAADASTGDDDTADPPTTGAEDSGDADSGATSPTPDPTSATAGETLPGDDTGGDDGCGCRTAAPPLALLPVLLLLRRRARRPRVARTGV